MHKIMIVDDEEIIRLGLVKNITWEQHQIEVIATAKNGKEAIEILETLRPDIIISDIEMPFMDGLHFADYIYQFYPQIKVILLTAYKEFDYAVKAVACQVFRYVLKYEGNEAILKGVQDAILALEQEREEKALINENRGFLVKHLFREVSLGRLTGQDVEKYFKQYNLKLHNKCYCVVCASLEWKNMYRANDFIEKKKYFNHIENTLKIRLENKGFEVYSFDSEDNLYFVLGNDESRGEDELTNLVKEWYESIGEDLKKSCYISLGKYHRGIEEIKYSYGEAAKAMELKEILHSDLHMIKFGKDIEGQGSSVEVVEMVCEYIKDNYYNEDLSLNSIAEVVHLSPNYISTLFKKYMGRNIIDYIIEIRISHAEKLLLETNCKTYEIANKIGYTNSQYFSVLFKKNKGMSPTDYRQYHQMPE